MELKDFITKINSPIIGNHKIDEINFENWYKEILNKPIIFLKKENELNLNSNIKDKNIYVTDIDKNSIRKLIDFSCGNFLTIYSQLLNDSIINNNKNLFLISIEKILILSKICGILKLRLAQAEFINIILNMINLNEKDELNENMIEMIVALMNHINDYCQYIHIEWGDILKLISKLAYYLVVP